MFYLGLETTAPASRAQAKSGPPNTELRSRRMRRMFLPMLLLAAAVGCGEQGGKTATEKAKDAVDSTATATKNAIDATGEAAEKAAEAAKHTGEKAASATKDAAESLKNAASGAFEKADEAVHKTGEATKEAAQDVEHKVDEIKP